MWKLTIDPEKSPDKPEHFTVEFTKGIPTRLEYNDDGKKKTVTEAVELFTTANAIARRNGVGRIDILENRFVGIKSRGEYSEQSCPKAPCFKSAKFIVHLLSDVMEAC